MGGLWAVEPSNDSFCFMFLNLLQPFNSFIKSSESYNYCKFRAYFFDFLFERAKMIEISTINFLNYIFIILMILIIASIYKKNNIKRIISFSIFRTFVLFISSFQAIFHCGIVQDGFNSIIIRIEFSIFHFIFWTFCFFSKNLF